MAERITVNSKKPIPIKENLISHRRKTDFRSDDSPVNRILYLQRTIGNQAVQRLVKSRALQAKLRIGQPGDVYKQEADRVADAVMRMPEPEMQRQVDEEEEEEILQTKPLVDQITPVVQRQVEEEEEEEMLQAKSREDATSEVSNDLESQINVIKGGGRPMAESERGFFEPRFGYDFSQVRVHTNAQAVESARAVNARAYTVGRDVVFGAGQYASWTSEGRRLLAHELVHTVQQGGSRISPNERHFSARIGGSSENVLQRKRHKTSGECYVLTENFVSREGLVRHGYVRSDVDGLEHWIQPATGSKVFILRRVKGAPQEIPPSAHPLNQVPEEILMEQRLLLEGATDYADWFTDWYNQTVSIMIQTRTPDAATFCELIRSRAELSIQIYLAQEELFPVWDDLAIESSREDLERQKERIAEISRRNWSIEDWDMTNLTMPEDFDFDKCIGSPSSEQPVK